MIAGTSVRMAHPTTDLGVIAHRGQGRSYEKRGFVDPMFLRNIYDVVGRTCRRIVRHWPISGGQGFAMFTLHKRAP